MLREWKDSAFARAFKRFAQLAVVSIALAGLTACGGGGGKKTTTPTTPIAPTTPEIPITPPPGGDHADTIAGATAIASGQNVTGTIASENDVDFFRLEFAERSTFEFTLDAEAGIEIAILDSDGNVIATAETASETTTTVSAPKGPVFVRILDKAKRGWDRLNQTKGVKAYKFATTIVDPIRNLFNVIRGIPHVNLTAGGVGFEFDYRDHIELPDGRQIVSNVTTYLPGVSVSIQGTTVRLNASAETRHGGVRFVLKLCVPVVNNCFFELFKGTVGGPRLTVKPEYLKGESCPTRDEPEGRV